MISLTGIDYWSFSVRIGGPGGGGEEEVEVKLEMPDTWDVHVR